MKKADFSKIKVKFIPQGKTVKVRRLKEGHIPEVTEFNFAIVEFDSLFERFRDKSLAISKRRKKSTKNFRVLAYEHPQIINPAIKTIIKLANLTNKPYKNHKNRFLYQKALAEIYKIMAQKSYREGINNSLGLLLERGALLIGAFYNYPRGHLAKITAKRLDYENGEFGLGLSNLVLPKNVRRFKALHIQEDCIATGDSIVGTVLALKEKGIIFNEIRIDAAVVVQTGVEFIQKILKYLGIKKVIIRTGDLCFKMNEHFYLMKNNKYFVGDMGEWTGILPKSFDKLAWWNKNRLDYLK
ncbi:hypothetical protein ISS86_00130 [Candidatus Microgenomates bacterium]|nr:hypothetical protein [Candidatus Microgenomates bacterium]